MSRRRLDNCGCRSCGEPLRLERVRRDEVQAMVEIIFACVAAVLLLLSAFTPACRDPITDWNPNAAELQTKAAVISVGKAEGPLLPTEP